MKSEIVINFPPPKGSKTVITIGKGKASRLVGRSKRAFIVADKKVALLYPLLIPAERVFLMDGEESGKSFEGLKNLLEWLSGSKCDRGDTIIAVGGGAVGDVAGFAASAYMRGIGWSVVPTTLLSMIDSSIGGKTAINIGWVKNGAGSFHQPERVVIDPSFLTSLQEREYLSGIGEVIKSAAIADRSLFELLSVKRNKILERDLAVMGDVIASCCKHKGSIVSADPRDEKGRMALNAGHTLAHAIESDSGFAISHGQAVAIGLYYETLIGERVQRCKKGTAAKIADLLALYNCPSSYCPVSMEKFLGWIRSDKKQRGESIYIPFIERIGKVTLKKVKLTVFDGIVRELFKTN